MTDIRNFLTHDHRHCDDLFAAAEEALALRENKADAASFFASFRSAMLAHFAAEEETLFPAFETRTGMTQGPTQVMRMEHEQIRVLMDAAVQALAADDTDAYFGHAETLLIMMQQHNMKEENILYPMCDQQLADERASIIERLEQGLATQ